MTSTMSPRSVEAASDMAASRADALFKAAHMLVASGRRQSAQDLLRAAFGQGRNIKAIHRNLPALLKAEDAGLARDFLTILSGFVSGQPAPVWLTEAELTLDGRTPFTAEELRLRLAAVPQGQLPAEPGPVCYVLHKSLPEDTTGYSMRSHAFIRALQAWNLPLYCITRFGFPNDLGQQSSADRHIVDQVTYHRIGGDGRRQFKNAAYFEQSAKALAARLGPLRPRAIMAASNHENAAAALLAARRLGVPFIYDLRGFWELSRLSFDPDFGKTAQFRIIHDLEAEIARQADLVFTLTVAMQEELSRRGVRETPVRILPNAADPARFRPRPRDARLAAQLGIPEDVAVIGYIGSFNPYEGLDDLARACATLHRQGVDFRLLLVGDEPGHLKGLVEPELRRIVAEGGFGAKVIMPGRVPGDAAEQWYSLIDIAPIPRKSLRVTELVPPLKALEAMAMEKAALVTALPALQEIVRDRQTGIVVAKDDPEALVAGLMLLLRNPALRQTLGRNARRWVVEERNWDVLAQHCLEAIDALSALRQPGSAAAERRRLDRPDLSGVSARS